VHSRYAELLRRWHHAAREELGELPDVPAEIFMAAVAAADEIVAARIVEGKERLLDVTPTLLYLHLALFGMADAARVELQG
jgi:hypothetical protein